ncbi:MAG TPA: FHA domain-containing protein, partial [Ilumatobacteraceae bacterium]|nr:FHA domain-containing protein [Ilumatobacteraceae bacterium]
MSYELRMANGGTVELDAAVVIGRGPAEPGVRMIIVDDPLVSKAHLDIDVAGGVLRVRDRGSSNGSVLRQGGVDVALTPHAWTAVGPDAALVVGETVLTVVPRAAAPGTVIAGHGPSGSVGQAPPDVLDMTIPTGSAGLGGRGYNPGPTPASTPPTSPAPAGLGPAPGALLSPGLHTPPTTPGNGRKRLVIALVAVVVIAALVVGGIAVFGGDDSSSASAEQLPRVVTERPKEQWAVDVDGSIGGVAADGSRVFIATAANDRARVQAVARDTGDEVWNARFGRT